MPSRRPRTRPVIAKAKARSDGSVASRARANGDDTGYEGNVNEHMGTTRDAAARTSGKKRARHTGTSSWVVWWSWPVSSLFRTFLPAKTSRRSGRASSRWSSAAHRVSSTLGASTAVANEGVVCEYEWGVSMRVVGGWVVVVKSK